ncbi:MAG: phenylalanine--tRNA ligase subunit beta [Pseudomonadota bacterium]
MLISESWLRELVNPELSTKALAHQITMAGLEVDGIELAAPEFKGVVIGKVLDTEQHPDAEKLRVCTVDIGASEPSRIVCGAPNVRAGLTVAVATVGARLPGKIKIRKAKLRGVESHGMICSSRELGLGDEHDGIMELPDLPIGQDFRDVFGLDDHVIELGLTPNRGDCLGMFGVARDVAALNQQQFDAPKAAAIAAQVDDQIAIHLDAPDYCARYCGRVVRHIRTDAQTPVWMVERLRRAGIRAIHPVVDITNYVMIESGKPMHGFDLKTMNGDVRVRLAEPGEALTLLDGREITLDSDILVIADDSGARALGGIMGGSDSGVSDATTDVFFESAYFDPLNIAGKARRFGLHTDASHRFERGVDPDLCADSIERATELLLAICGGEPGPVVTAEVTEHLPKPAQIELEHAHLERLIGRAYERTEVTQIFRSLGCDVSETDAGWQVTAPTYRFDLAIAEDLIEEVVRIHGYDEVEPKAAVAELGMGAARESNVDSMRMRDYLVARGYHEAITYSFVDPKWHALLVPNVTPLPLSNPISSDLSVMRAGLLPGLLGAVKKNLSRQKTRVRLYEAGLRFIPQNNEIKQENVIGIIATGARYAEQWGQDSHSVGFFDVKLDVETLLTMGGMDRQIDFVADQHPVLHPGQTARIVVNGEDAGWLGTLHPRVAKNAEVEGNVVYCELIESVAMAASVPQFAPLSKYPAVRRDLAMIVPESVSIERILATAESAAPASLKDLRVFDIYRGKGIEDGAKSVALGLILQDSSRTLTDVEIDAAMAEIAAQLQENLQAKIRD